MRLWPSIHRQGLSGYLLLLLLAAGMLTLAAPAGEARSLPKKPRGYVSDSAGLLSSATRTALESQLRKFDKQTTNQILVVAIDSLKGEPLTSFSMRLAEAWKPGVYGEDNGAILLIVKRDRRVRIEVGYGLEGTLTDAFAKLIIEDIIKPNFRKNLYDRGVLEAVKAIMKAAVGDYDDSFSARSGDDANPLFVGLALGCALFAGLVLPPPLVVTVVACSFLAAGYSLMADSRPGLIYALILGFLPLTLLVLFRKKSWYDGETLTQDGTFKGLSGGYYARRGGTAGGSFSGGGGFSGRGGGFGGGGASGGW